MIVSQMIVSQRQDVELWKREKSLALFSESQLAVPRGHLENSCSTQEREWNRVVFDLMNDDVKWSEKKEKNHQNLLKINDVEINEASVDMNFHECL